MQDTTANMRNLEERILDMGDLAAEIGEHTDEDGFFLVFPYSQAIADAMNAYEVTDPEEAFDLFCTMQEDLFADLNDLEAATGQRSRLRHDPAR